MTERVIADQAAPAHGSQSARTPGRPADREWRVIRPARHWSLRVGARELWEQRELALTLALRDLRLRYRQTAFGVGWALLQPLLAVGLFSGVFGALTDVPSDGLPYPVFVLGGLVVWFFVSTAVTAAAESLTEHPDLITKVWFPRMLAPLAAVLASGVDLALTLVLLVVAMVAYGVAPGPQVLTLPIWLVSAFLVAVATSLWLSAANVLYRDIRYALGFVLQLWFFASPVVFSASLIDGIWRYLFALNPLAGVITGFRWAVLGAPAPGAWLAVSAASALALLVFGATYFRAAERSFADRI